MLQNLYFEKIEIYSDILGLRKKVFSWNFKKINFLFGKNNSGKTTFFHIFKDILGNPNVAGNNTTGKNILTDDLLTKNLEVILDFSIGDSKFYTIKEYKEKTRQMFYKSNGDIIGSFQFFLEYLESEKILVLPEVIYGGKNKITLNSLMRFCFIEQSHFGRSFKVEKHKSSNIIIKHNNDGRSKVLLYLYLFSILTDSEKLTEHYNKLAIFSEKDNELEIINKQITTLTKDNSYDLNNGLFDDKVIINKIKKLENQKRRLILNNINYQDIIKSFKDIYDLNKVEINKLSDTYVKYLELLKNDIIFINRRINDNNNLLIYIDSEIKKFRLQIEAIDKMLLGHFVITLDSLDIDDKNLLKTLYKNQENLKLEIEEYKEYYQNLINILKESGSFDLLISFVNEFIGFLDDIELGLEINLESGKYTINTTSDSINRIVLFNILLSFIFLKEKIGMNHLGFIVFDSPFAGLDKSREIDSINNFIDNYEKYLFNGQVFIFLNPDEISEKDLSKNNGEDISIKKANGKLFNFE